MRASRGARIRRLLGDLLRGETRGDALRRMRRRAGREVRRIVPGTRGGVTASRAATTGPGASNDRPDSWYVGEWSRLAGTVLGSGPDADGARLDPAQAPEIVKQVHRFRGQAALAAAISRGEPLELAVRRSVEDLCDALEWSAAWALAEGVGRLPNGAVASALGHAILLHRRRQIARAWTVIRDLDDTTLATWLPVEAVDAALATGTEEARRRAIAIAEPRAAMGSAALVDLAGRMLAFDERERAAELAAELRRRSPEDLDGRRRHAWTLIEGWLARRQRAVPPGSVPFAILDYQTPDHVLTSGNVGDYIQTLALIGNLVRFERVAITGEGDLGALAGDLRQQVRPDVRDRRVTGSVHLIPVDRDFSSASDAPEGTWMFAFGWHMHSLFDLRYDFPYHPNIRPLFLSFHVNRLDMLSAEALEYLRERGPIGCRDWTTVFLLLGAGVDAFFSGCLTTTVDAVFPARDAVVRGPGSVGVIDLPLRVAGPDAAGARVYSHQSDDYRSMSLTDGVRAARDLLAGYQRDLRRAVTGRLHAYLPLTAIGVPVEFRTGGPGDVRFAGLTGFTPGDPHLAEMQGGIRDLVAGILEPILAGAGETDVYARWRERTAEGLAEARRRFEAPGAGPDTTIDIGAAVASARRASRRFGPHEAVDPAAVTDVVLAFDQNLTLPAAVLLESMLANASGPVRLWLLGRGLDDAYVQWLADAFPALPITYLPCDEITFGAAGRRPRRLPRRITVSTMDRLLLPDLLDAVERVVYLDVDTLMPGDVCTLARIDLGGHAVAARDSNVSEASEWQRSGRNLAEPLALEIRRTMGRRHGYGHAALNAGVLVMDLDRLRRDGFTRQALGWVEAYGFHDQDALLAYLGPERAALDARWNAMPVLEDVADPAVIHWASFGKPWEPQLTYSQDRWREYADRLRQRAGPPPTGGRPASAPGTLGNPIEVDPATAALPPEVERVVDAVLAEHLTYLGPVGLRDLAAAVEATEAHGIDGLIVEAGTALGGSAIAMAAAKSTARPMKLYDVFTTIPAPSAQDGPDAHRRYAVIASGHSKGIAGETYYGYRGELVDHVTESFVRHGLPIADNNVELIKGLFEDTIRLDEPVALAHLDGDWYASTMTCLSRLAPLLSVGGRLVIDDYDTWSGCRAAVDEYFAGRPGFRFERRARLHVVRV